MQERIICDYCAKEEKRIWGNDPNEDFNVKIVAVNDMYKWLYKQGVLEKVSFCFEENEKNMFFALEVKDLIPYKEQMKNSGIKNAEIAIYHIFDAEYMPCLYSGAIQLSWTMFTYRGTHCIGRSWEIGEVQHLNDEYAYKVKEIKNKKGVKEAVKYIYSL